MSNLKLTINLLPKGAWGNDLSKTLPKKDWDTLREACYKRANYRCSVCGWSVDELDAHEEWNFDLKSRTQTLKDIVALCSRCHGVKHFRHSERIGYGENAKNHFCKVNKCDLLTFANHYAEAQYNFDTYSEVLRWKMKCDLDKFGGKGIEFKERKIPFVLNPYKNISWAARTSDEYSSCFKTHWNGNSLALPPKVRSVEVNNYDGTVTVNADYVNKIQWLSDDQVIKTKYNVAGRFITKFNVENVESSNMRFNLIGEGGETYFSVVWLVNISKINLETKSNISY